MLNVKYVDRQDSGQIGEANVHEYYYDKDCQSDEESFFQVYAPKELTEALACENQIGAKFSASKQDAARKKLKDLDL